MVEYSSTPYLLLLADVRGDRHHVRHGDHPTLSADGCPVDVTRSGAGRDLVPRQVGTVFFLLFAMAKAMVPRYRYDQLMGRLEGVAAAVARHGRRRRRGAAIRGLAWQEAPMNVRTIGQIAVLWEFVTAFGMSMRYFFSKKKTASTIPSSTGRCRRAFAASTRCGATPTARSAAWPRQAVRGDVPGAGHHHRSRPAPQRRYAACSRVRWTWSNACTAGCREACPVDAIVEAPRTSSSRRSARGAPLQQREAAR